MKKMARTSKVCSRLMTVPGVGPITSLAFAAAIDDPSRFRRSRDVDAYLGLAPRRYQSGEIDDTGSISKRGDVRVRTLLDEAANVMHHKMRSIPRSQRLGQGNRCAVHNEKSQSSAGKTARHHHACNDARRNRIPSDLAEVVNRRGYLKLSSHPGCPREGVRHGDGSVATARTGRSRFPPCRHTPNQPHHEPMSSKRTKATPDAKRRKFREHTFTD